MRAHNIALAAGFLAGISLACTPTVAPPPLPEPERSGIPDPRAPTIRYLRFSPNLYRYQFEQVAQIFADGTTDTVPSAITTRAIILVTVAAEADSSIRVSMSFNSISVTTQGLIPSRGFSQVATLDSVLQAAFAYTQVTIETHLPDSLCAYSQFVNAARELLLPELGIEIESSETKVYRDTATQIACRAGTSIELTTTRELRDLGRQPAVFRLQQRTEIHGAGQLRRDSLTVSGSIATQGMVAFATGNRLPSLVQTTSEGTITVQLGSLTTIFRQTSHQEIRLEGLPNP